MRRLQEAAFQISQRFGKIGTAPEETVHALVLVDTPVLVDGIDCASPSDATCGPADLIENGPTAPFPNFYFGSGALRLLAFERWDWLIDVEAAHCREADVRLTVRSIMQTYLWADRIIGFSIHTGS